MSFAPRTFTTDMLKHVVHNEAHMTSIRNAVRGRGVKTPRLLMPDRRRPFARKIAKLNTKSPWGRGVVKSFHLSRAADRRVSHTQVFYPQPHTFGLSNEIKTIKSRIISKVGARLAASDVRFIFFTGPPAPLQKKRREIQCGGG
jgi:hypothetical protein